jgi:hypothetical protein
MSFCAQCNAQSLAIIHTDQAASPFLLSQGYTVWNRFIVHWSPICDQSESGETEHTNMQEVTQSRYLQVDSKGQKKPRIICELGPQGSRKLPWVDEVLTA